MTTPHIRIWWHDAKTDKFKCSGYVVEVRQSAAKAVARAIPFVRVITEPLYRVASKRITPGSNDTRFDVSASQTELKIESLAPGEFYHFKVWAINEFGVKKPLGFMWREIKADKFKPGRPTITGVEYNDKEEEEGRPEDQGEPQIQVAPEELEWDLDENGEVQQHFQIFNAGNAPLTLYSVMLNSSAPQFTIENSDRYNGMILQPRNGVSIIVSFKPVHSGKSSNKVLISSNDIKKGLEEVTLKGKYTKKKGKLHIQKNPTEFGKVKVIHHD